MLCSRPKCLIIAPGISSLFWYIFSDLWSNTTKVMISYFLVFPKIGLAEKKVQVFLIKYINSLLNFFQVWKIPTAIRSLCAMEGGKILGSLLFCIVYSRVNSCKTTRTWHIPWIKFWRFSFKRKTVEKSYFEGLIALSRVSILQKNTFRWTVEQPRCLQAINHSTKASFCHPLRKI